MDDILLAGKTGTAEIKASKDDTSGTELGWFAIFTAEDTVEHPILIISMVEDVKGRGGSGYVVKKDGLVLEEWFSRGKKVLDAVIVTIWMPDEETFEGMRQTAKYLFDELCPLEKVQEKKDHGKER